MIKKIIYIIIILLSILFLMRYHIAIAESPEPTYDDLLETWVHDLAMCESTQNPSAVNKYDGGSPSYGYLQYKLGTMWAYNNKFKLFPEMTLDNLHYMTMQKDVQVAMTKEIIKRDYAWKNWTNCTKKIGLPPKQEVL